jgi:hypothetical protein
LPAKPMQLPPSIHRKDGNIPVVEASTPNVLVHPCCP